MHLLRELSHKIQTAAAVASSIAELFEGFALSLQAQLQWLHASVVAAESLALTLQASCNLKDSKELFERCLNARKVLLPDDHIQVDLTPHM